MTILLSKHFWAKVVNTVCQVINRIYLRFKVYKPSCSFTTVSPQYCTYLCFWLQEFSFEHKSLSTLGLKQSIQLAMSSTGYI